MEPMINSYEITHDHFKARERESEARVLRVEWWLQCLGNLVTRGPKKIAERHADWRSCTDGGDLRITKGHREEQMAHPLRIEVKGILKYSFNCLENYPYPTALICACHQFDDADPKPHAYISVGQDLRGATVLLVEKSRRDWVKKERKDWDRSEIKGSDSIQLCYHTHLKHLTFVDLCNPDPRQNPL